VQDRPHDWQGNLYEGKAYPHGGQRKGIIMKEKEKNNVIFIGGQGSSLCDKVQYYFWGAKQCNPLLMKIMLSADKVILEDISLKS
jgi:hypothetical protein